MYSCVIRCIPSRHAIFTHQLYRQYIYISHRILKRTYNNNVFQPMSYSTNNQSSMDTKVKQLPPISTYDADTFFSQPTWSLMQLFVNIDNTDIDIADVDIERLYSLSMLHVPVDNTAGYSIKSMIQWMSSIHNVNTDNVQPIYTPIQIIENNTNNDKTLHSNSRSYTERYRSDIVSDGNYQSDILRNAPNTDKGFVLVPKVVDYT